MNTQKLYDYLFRTLASISQDTPAKFVVNKKKAKTEELRHFFADVAGAGAFSNILREIGQNEIFLALYNKQATPLKKASDKFFLSDKESIAKLEALEETHHLLGNNEDKLIIQKKYIEFYKIAKIIACLYEDNVIDDDDNDDDSEDSENERDEDELAYENAYKILVLFGNEEVPSQYFKTLDEYLKTHNFLNANNPIHDALVNNLPVCKKGETVTLSVWRSIILRNGPKAARLFANAADIEKQLGHAPNNFQEASDAASTVIYPRKAKNPELAEVALQYFISNDIFERCLSIKIKKTDLLPSIVIDGNSVNQPGYYLVKLPIDDPRTFFLGEITNCCQSIGNNGHFCIIDGLTRQNNGFYVLLKKTSNQNKPPMVEGKIDYNHFKIVGQGYAWKSKKGNLVFDSWENVAADPYDAVVVPMLEAFAKEVCATNTDILQVTIGVGGKTPGIWANKSSDASEKMLEGKKYGDAEKQVVVYYNDQHLEKLKKYFIVELKSPKEETEQFINKKSFDTYTEQQNILTLCRDVYFQNEKNLPELFKALKIATTKKIQSSLWRALYTLKQADILNEKTVAALFKIIEKHFTYSASLFENYQDDLDTFANALVGLHNDGNLNDKNTALIADHPSRGQAVCDIYFYIGKDLFTDQIHNILRRNIEQSAELWFCLRELKHFKMIDAANLDSFLQTKNKTDDIRDFKYPTEVLRKFEKQNLITEEVMKAVVDWELGYLNAYLELHKNNLLNEENKALIYTSTDAQALAKALIALEKDTSLPLKIVKPTLALNPSRSHKVLEGLKVLNQANLLTEDNAKALASINHDFFSNINNIYLSASELFVNMHAKNILNAANREYIVGISGNSTVFKFYYLIGATKMMSESNFALAKAVIEAIAQQVNLNTNNVKIDKMTKDLERLYYGKILNDLTFTEYLNAALKEYSPTPTNTGFSPG